jgi:hypothetical protein
VVGHVDDDVAERRVDGAHDDARNAAAIATMAWLYTTGPDASTPSTLRTRSTASFHSSRGPLKLVTVMCGLKPRILSRRSRSMPVMTPSTMSSVATPIVTPASEMAEMSESGTRRWRLRM